MMKNLMLRFVIVALSVIASSNLQKVIAWEFCFSGCKTLIVQREAKSEEESGGDVINTDYAMRAGEKYSEIQLSEDHSLGYSWVKFSLLDSDGNKVQSFERQPVTAKKIVDRSLLDWLKNMFRESKDTVLVSIDVSDKNGTLLATHPLYAATYSDGFRSILSENDISLAGTIGFPRKSNEVHVVKLSIRYADSDVVGLDTLKSVIEAAGDLSNLLPNNTTGWINEGTLTAFNSASSRLEGILGEFTSTTNLSSEVEMSHKDGSIIGFKYYFKASGEKLLSSVVVWVALEYVQSIFKYEGIVSFDNLMNVDVHQQGQSTTSLKKYIEGHDASRNAVDSLSQAEADIIGVCDAIRSVLSMRFNALDTALALNAYIGSERSKFRKHFKHTCFRAEEKKWIVDEGVAIFDPSPIEQFEITNLAPNQQFNVLKLMSDAVVSSFDDDLRDAKAEIFFLRTGSRDREFILVDDEIGALYGNPRRLQLLSRDFYSDLSRVTFERALGCYSGDFLDTPDQPNVIGSLSIFEGLPIEVLLEFHAVQENPNYPTLERISFTRPSSDRLLLYRDGDATRQIRGCAGGFAPWNLTVASDDYGT